MTITYEYPNYAKIVEKRILGKRKHSAQTLAGQPLFWNPFSLGEVTAASDRDLSYLSPLFEVLRLCLFGLLARGPSFRFFDCPALFLTNHSIISGSFLTHPLTFHPLRNSGESTSKISRERILTKVSY